jgi:hypothetical protein
VRRIAIVLSLLAALALLLAVIGHAYTQGNGTGNETAGGSTAGCCVCASAYASTDDEHVNVIRQFRDRYLATNPVGRGVIVLYYDVVSPPLAAFINDHPSVKPLARTALAPVVSLSAVALDTSTTEKAAIGGSLALLSAGALLWIKRRVRRRRRPA